MAYLFGWWALSQYICVSCTVDHQGSQIDFHIRTSRARILACAFLSQAWTLQILVDPALRCRHT